MWIFFCNWWSICVSWIYHHLMFRYLLMWRRYARLWLSLKRLTTFFSSVVVVFLEQNDFCQNFYIFYKYDFDSSHEWWEFILMLLFLIKLNDHHTMKLDMGLCSHMMSIGCLEETTGYNINATVTIKTKYTITDRTHS